MACDLQAGHSFAISTSLLSLFSSFRYLITYHDLLQLTAQEKKVDCNYRFKERNRRKVVSAFVDQIKEGSSFYLSSLTFFLLPSSDGWRNECFHHIFFFLLLPEKKKRGELMKDCSAKITKIINSAKIPDFGFPATCVALLHHRLAFSCSCHDPTQHNSDRNNWRE